MLFKFIGRSPKLWPSERLLNGPAVFIESATESRVISKSKVFGPFGDIHSNAIESDIVEPNSRSVVCLFFSRGPANIAGLIVAVVIDSINRMFGRWSLTHVCKKLTKILNPFGANLNPFISVPPIPSRLVSGVASPLHIAPRKIFFRAGHRPNCTSNELRFQGDT